jgi:hypothetical protein
MIIAMNVCAENRPLQGWRQRVGQQQIGDSPKLVAGRRMPGNFNSQTAQLLYQAPHLRAARTNLVGNLGAAHDHGSVVHQQAHNPPQAQVSPLWRGSCGRGRLARAVFRTFGCVASSVMQRMICGRGTKDKSALLEDGRPT